MFIQNDRYCRWLRPLLLVCLSASLTGCGESGPPRAAIEGEVTIGGQPLKAGRITFAPQAPTQGPATTLAIVAGRYQAERSHGPLVGLNLIQVEADPDLGFPLDDEQAFAALGAMPAIWQPIQPEFNLNSQLTTEIRAGEVNRCDVTIPAIVPSARN
ncbi:MAG TPA: hypothetical protein VMP01_00345 [Pirellulaceae bacterium]|nr:hypothetical protein [Pirellulaceae bacterium]